MTILEEIAAYARHRVEIAKREHPLEELADICQEREPGLGQGFIDALAKPGLSFICEVKKASPSKGIISRDFPYLDIAGDYQGAGADAISCLTEPKWFLGSDEIFQEVRSFVSIPMLRKDFTVDEYQIYQGKALGANAVLLICALLNTETLNRYLDICEQLGLAALVEAHNREEVASAVAAGANIIGVNNRNLNNFQVDFSNAAGLRDSIPPGTLYVAESGVASVEDVAALRAIGADAVLIGEVLMRAGDKAALLRDMREAAL